MFYVETSHVGAVQALQAMPTAARPPPAPSAGGPSGLQAPMLEADVASASDSDDDRVIPMSPPTSHHNNHSNNHALKAPEGFGNTDVLKRSSKLSTSCGSDSSIAYEDEDVGAVGGFGGFAPQFFGGRPGGVVARNTKGPRTWDGVFLPVSLAVFGAVLFLRLPWCIGQAGLLYTLLAILCCFTLSGLTLVSLAAMSTNGLTDKGGAYMMASRTLGPQIGLSVGVLLIIANIIAGAIYLLAASPVVVIALPWQWLKQTAHSYSYITPVVIASLFLFTLLVVGLLKLDRPFRGVSMLLTIVALIDLIVAMGIETQDPNEMEGFTGFNATVLRANLNDDYDDGVQFETILAVLLPGATGILPGLSLSGDLRHAEKAIPRGIGYAWLLSFSTYVVVAILIAASYTQETLKATNVPLHDPNRRWAFVPGEICACFASVLAGLAGSAKVVEAISIDDLVPLFGPVTRVLRTYPRLRLFGVYFLMQLVIFIGPYSGQYNAASAWASVVFCTVFLSLNLGTFLSRASGVSSFRPTYAFFNRSTAGFGALGSVAMMFTVGPIQSLAALILLALLFVGFEALHDPQRVFWGDAAQPITFHLVRKWLLMLDVRKEHPSHWRPNVLQVTTDVEASLNLIHFANNLKKGGLYQLGVVIKGDFVQTRHEVSRWRDLLLCFIRASGIKGFPAVVYGPTLRAGAQMLLTDSGLGGMRPNTILLSIDDFCDRAAHTRNALYHVSQRQHHHNRSMFASGRVPAASGPATAGGGVSHDDPTLRSVWATGLGAVASTRAQPHSLYTSTGRVVGGNNAVLLTRHALNSARGPNGSNSAFASARSLPDLPPRRPQPPPHHSGDKDERPVHRQVVRSPSPAASAASAAIPIRRGTAVAATGHARSSAAKADEEDELVASPSPPPPCFEQTMPRGIARPLPSSATPTPAPTNTTNGVGGDQSASIFSSPTVGGPAGLPSENDAAALSSTVDAPGSAPFAPEPFDATTDAMHPSVDLFGSADSAGGMMSRKSAFRSVRVFSAPHEGWDGDYTTGDDKSASGAAAAPPAHVVGRYRSGRQRSNSVAAVVSKAATSILKRKPAQPPPPKAADDTRTDSLHSLHHQRQHQNGNEASPSINHASGIGRLTSTSSGSKLNLLEFAGDDRAATNTDADDNDGVTITVPTVPSGAFDALPPVVRPQHHPRRQSVGDLYVSEGKRSSTAWASPNSQMAETQSRFPLYESTGTGGGGKPHHQKQNKRSTQFVTNRRDADEDVERETLHRMRRVRAAAALNSGGDLATFKDELEFFGLVNDACESQFSVLLARNFQQLDRDDVADCKPFAYVDVWLPPESDPVLFLTAHCLSHTSVWAENARLRVVGLSWTEEEAQQAKAITVSILKHHRIRAEVHVIVIRDRCETIFEAIKPSLLRYAKQLKVQRADDTPAAPPAAQAAAAAAAATNPSASDAAPSPPVTKSSNDDGFLRSRPLAAADVSQQLSASAKSSDNGALGKTLADLALMEESTLQASFFARTYRPPPAAGQRSGSKLEPKDSPPRASMAKSDASFPPNSRATVVDAAAAATKPPAMNTASSDPRNRMSTVEPADFERMQSYMGHDHAAVDDAMRTAFAASIADPIQRAITLNYLIRDEVSRGNGRSKLILMRADDPVAGAALGAANADIAVATAAAAASSAAPVSASSLARLSGELEAAAAAADEALRREVLAWTTHIDLLTAGLPPVVLFCGGGSMMQTPEW